MDVFNIKCKTLYRHTVNKRMTQKGASAYFHCIPRKKDGYSRPHLDFCSQKRNRSIFSMFTSCVVCACDRNIGDLLLCCTKNSKCNIEWCYLYL